MFIKTGNVKVPKLIFLSFLKLNMEGLMRFGGLEEQFSHISENAINEKTPFLQMLQCIEPEPNQILQSLLQSQTLEPESCLTLETIKRDPGLEEDPVKDPKIEDGAEAKVKEKRKRKRTRAPKNKDEVESQRMTHIAVERNRRRQMNEHLNSLRSLMPPTFLQRVTKDLNILILKIKDLKLIKKRFKDSKIYISFFFYENMKSFHLNV